MKKYMILTALMVSVFTLVGPVAHADSASQVRQQIQADYNSQDAAMARKDPKGAMAYVDPAFVGSGPGKAPESYQKRVQAQAQLFTEVQTIQMTTRIQKFALRGTAATVQITDRATVKAPDPKTHMATNLTFVYIIADQWVKRPSGWRLLRSRQLAMKVLP